MELKIDVNVHDKTFSAKIEKIFIHKPSALLKIPAVKIYHLTGNAKVCWSFQYLALDYLWQYKTIRDRLNKSRRLCEYIIEKMSAVWHLSSEIWDYHNRTVILKIVFSIFIRAHPDAISIFLRINIIFTGFYFKNRIYFSNFIFQFCDGFIWPIFQYLHNTRKYNCEVLVKFQTIFPYNGGPNSSQFSSTYAPMAMRCVLRGWGGKVMEAFSRKRNVTAVWVLGTPEVFCFFSENITYP